MNVKLLTEHHFEFLSLKGGSSESTLVKFPHCWKSHVTAQTVAFRLWVDSGPRPYAEWNCLRSVSSITFVQISSVLAVMVVR